MKTIATILLFFIFLNLDIEPAKRFSIKSDYILTDALGTIYSIKGNSISSFNAEGQKLFSYSNPFLGDISFVDVKNPMRILLFYKDFNQVIFLSNKLSVIGSPVELDNTGHSQVSICCSSNQDGFWIFDNQTLQLIHLNDNLEAIHKGTILQEILKNTEKSPTCLIEENDHIYMAIQDIGILVFDKFGSYIKTLPILIPTTFQVKGDKIIYFSKNTLHSYINNLDMDSLSLPHKLNLNSVSINKNQLFGSNSEEIFLFNLSFQK